MKRLLTFCLLLIVTFALIAFVSISIGRGQPASKAVQYWHLTDCAPPCWAGITPGVTSIEEAMERVSSQFSDFEVQPEFRMFQRQGKVDSPTEKDMNRIAFGVDTEGFVYNISISTVGQHNFMVETMPTLGDLVALLGPPSCITMSSNPVYSSLYYVSPSGQGGLQIVVGQISATEATWSIGIYSPQSTWSCQAVDSLPWRGFRSAELYLADTANIK